MGNCLRSCLETGHDEGKQSSVTRTSAPYCHGPRSHQHSGDSHTIVRPQLRNQFSENVSHTHAISTASEHDSSGIDIKFVHDPVKKKEKCSRPHQDHDDFRAGRPHQALQDPDDFRAEASMHHNLRRECFQKAKKAYKGGKKEDAHYYSQQGNRHTANMKEANARAAEIILQLNNHKLIEENALDLHGLHVSEAITALEEILKSDRQYSSLTVITGRGVHSRGGMPRIRPAVISYLEEHGYQYTSPNPGLLEVVP